MNTMNLFRCRTTATVVALVTLVSTTSAQRKLTSLVETLRNTTTETTRKSIVLIDEDWPGVAPVATPADSTYNCYSGKENDEMKLHFINRFTYDASQRLVETSNAELVPPVPVDKNCNPLTVIDPANWYAISRAVVSYRTDGRRQEDFYDSSNQFTGRNVTATDAAGREIFKERWSVNWETKIPFVVERRIEAYNAYGNKTLSEYYYYDWNKKTLVGSQKFSEDFDAAGNTTHYIEYSWNNQSATWDNVLKFESIYEEVGGFPLIQKEYEWKNDAWLLTEQITTTHNPAAKMLTYSEIQLIDSSWVEISSGSITYLDSWKNILTLETTKNDGNYRLEYTYNASGLQTSCKYFQKIASQMILLEEEGCVYDEHNRITEEWSKQIISAAGSRTVNNYTAAGYLNNSSFYLWAAGGWKLSSIDEYTYDTNQLCTSYTNYAVNHEGSLYRSHKATRSFDTTGRLVVEALYNETTEVERTKYFFSAVTTAIQSPSAANAFPIHTIPGGVVMKNSTLVPVRYSIYTAAGSFVAHGSLTTGDTSIALPAGLYVVRIGHQRDKVVIK